MVGSSKAQRSYSLEFLKKSGSLQTSFPDLEKVWKIKIKCGKMVKSLENFLFDITETSALLLIFSDRQIFFKISSLAKTFTRRPRSLRSVLR